MVKNNLTSLQLILSDTNDSTTKQTSKYLDFNQRKRSRL